MNKTNNKTAIFDFWWVNLCLLRGSTGQDHMGEKCLPLGEFAELQEWLPLNTDSVHSKSQKGKQTWYKASTDKQNNLDWPHIQKRSMQKVETSPGLPGWSIETLPKSVGRKLGKPKLSWCYSCKGCERQQNDSVQKTWAKNSAWQGDLVAKSMDTKGISSVPILLFILFCFFISKIYPQPWG